MIYRIKVMVHKSGKVCGNKRNNNKRNNNKRDNNNSEVHIKAITRGVSQNCRMIYRIKVMVHRSGKVCGNKSNNRRKVIIREVSKNCGKIGGKKRMLKKK